EGSLGRETKGDPFPFPPNRRASGKWRSTPTDGGGDRAKIPRLDKQGDQVEAVGAGADAVPEDRLSQLPEDLLKDHILTRLPLKDAIRTGVLARVWRQLWKTRWGPEGSCSVEVRGSRDALQLKRRERMARPWNRIDRFSLVAETTALTAKELRSFVEYTAKCSVADLHVESRKRSEMLSFPVTKSSLDLERLSLRNFRISNMHYSDNHTKFRALGVIQLHCCTISNNRAFENMLKVSPSLLTLDLRGCTFIERWERKEWEARDKRLVMPPNLRTLTMAECVSYKFSRWKARLDLVDVPSLRSFRYSGDFIDSPFTLPRAAALDDLYIMFSHSSSASEKYNDVKLNEYLPEDLSRLNVLTISGNALRGASSLPDGGGPAQMPSLSLHNLRELQLLMFGLEAVNLAELYAFLKACPCPNLERLFVQLPESDYKPLEGSIDEGREELQLAPHWGAASEFFVEES
ncbi:hypothetical protein U9M48_026510, partial [Paspalum notatum var. saurae]